MRRTRLTSLILVIGLSLATAGWYLVSGAGEDVQTTGPSAPTAHALAEPRAPKAGALDVLPNSARAPVPDVPGLDGTRIERGPDLDDDALRGQLRRVAAVDPGDTEAFEAVLAPLLTNQKSMARIVFLLQGRGLAHAEAVLSAEEVGALRAIGAGCIVFNPLGKESALAVAGLAPDGRAFLVSVLEALVSVQPPAQGILAGLLGASRNEAGRLVLDLSYAAELDRLATLHPEAADLYLGLLAEASGDLADESMRALDLLQLTDERSPTLVNASLSRLLAGEDSPAALQWAAALHDRDDTDAALRRAVTTAVAAAAPVDQAAGFLAERADAELLVEFDMLGGRAGGLEAVEEEYYALRVFDDADDTARTMLVAGMGSAETSDLLAIAVDDPSARVRGQAWTTLTFAHGFEPTRRTVDLLREGFVNRNDRDSSVPTYAVITAAANLAAHASSRPEVLAEAIELLREIAADTTVSEHDRKKAIAKLARYVSPAEVARLRALL